MSTHVMDTRDGFGLEDFGRNLQLLRAAKSLLRIYIKLPLMLARHSLVLKEARDLLDRCRIACETTSCLESNIPSINLIRDTLESLLNDAKQISLLAPFRPFLKSALVEWDDFVEDCAIASDPEIRAMIRTIADAL